MNPERVAREFVAAVNSHQVEALSELMTEGHVFVDSDGSRKTGRQPVCQAWADYFSMVPDYRIIIEETLARGDTLVVLGRAQGSFFRDGAAEEEPHWSVPVAWRVQVEGDRVALWQLYVNPEVMQQALERIASP
jgi:ketosteroid isomerase-like protein